MKNVFKKKKKRRAYNLQNLSMPGYLPHGSEIEKVLDNKKMKAKYNSIY